MNIKRRLRETLNNLDYYDLIDRDDNDAIVGEQVEPTTFDPTVAVAATISERLGNALDELRTIANSSGTLTGAQLSNAVRALAKVAIALIRLELRRLDDTE